MTDEPEETSMNRRTRPLVALALLAGLTAAPSTARAAGPVPPAKVGRLGVDTSGNAFLTLEGVTIAAWGCATAGELRFNATTEPGKAMYATLLSAKLAGQKINIYNSGCWQGYPSIGWLWLS